MDNLPDMQMSKYCSDDSFEANHKRSKRSNSEHGCVMLFTLTNTLNLIMCFMDDPLLFCSFLQNLYSNIFNT